ncbi:hypothetical protein D3C71_2112440 [compost metagenome]
MHMCCASNLKAHVALVSLTVKAVARSLSVPDRMSFCVPEPFNRRKSWSCRESGDLMCSTRLASHSSTVLMV